MAKNEAKQGKENKHFIKDFKVELKKVSWPTPKQLLNNTFVVVVIVLITALIVFCLDLVFDSINKYGITNLQTMVQEKSSDEEKQGSQEESDGENSTENTSNEVKENTTMETNETENQ